MKKSTISFVTISILLFSMTAIIISNNIEKTNAYTASRLTLRNFKKIKLGGSPKQAIKILGKPHGSGSSGSSRSISYFQEFKKKAIEINIRIQKVKGKEIIVGKGWNENLR